MKHLATFVCLFCMISSISADQFTSGLPFITNYSEKDHHVSNNNHCIIQDKRGLLYFANDYGIVEFDGNKWQVIQVPSNRSNVLSLALDNNNRLYVGAQGDLGYIDYMPPYGLIFHSLLEQIPEEYKSFGDVVNTIAYDNQVVFQCWDGLYIYRNKQIKIYTLKDGILGAFKIDDQIIIQGVDGLYLFKDNKFEYISGTKELKNTWARFILPWKNSLIIGTHQSGLFELNKEHQLSPFDINPEMDLSSAQITTGKINKLGQLIIGTRHNGLVVINSDKQIINHINRTKGLQNNDISSIYLDQNDNLWVANKKGVDFIEMASPFTRILPDKDEPVEVYDATIFQNKLYLATHKGLLYAPLSDLNKVTPTLTSFKRVDGSNDINWKLQQIGSSLIVAHNNGFSLVDENKIKHTVSTYGGWQVIPLPTDSLHLIAGTYKGLVILQINGDQLKIENKIEGFDESSRVIEMDEDGYLWIAHGYKGIFKLKLSSDYSKVTEYQFYDSKKGLPTNFYNSVFNIDDQIIFGTEYGIYEYDSNLDSIQINLELTKNTWGWHIGRTLKQDHNGNIWYVGNDNAGIIFNHPDGRTSTTSLPFVKLNDFYIPGFESFTILPHQNVLIGGKDGLVYFNMEKNKLYHQPFQVILRSVASLKNDNEIIYNDRFEFLCDTILDSQHVLKSTNNSLQFNFATGFYENISHLSYQFYLEGFDDDWSNWTKESFKQYTNLSPGKYVFRVKAKNTYGTESNEATFRFSIKTPWYLTWPAIFAYVVVTILLILLIIRLRVKQITKEKKRLINQQRQSYNLELSKLKEQQLKQDLQSQKEELSGMAMKAIYKNGKLIELKENVESIKESASDKVARQLSKTLTFIDQELADDQWEDFEMRFDMAHNNLIKRLKEDFPDLTSKDLKLCAYLRMNLSTKEMAQLLNMTVRGVETARYRIRKRMNLDSSENLNEFILTY